MLHICGSYASVWGALGLRPACARILVIVNVRAPDVPTDLIRIADGKGGSRPCLRRMSTRRRGSRRIGIDTLGHREVLPASVFTLAATYGAVRLVRPRRVVTPRAGRLVVVRSVGGPPQWNRCHRAHDA